MTAFDGADLPEHGGRLRAAAQHWGIPPEQWLDLSTGINPVPWPVPAIPAEVWQRLPEPEDGLEEIIRIWAGAPERACCLPVAGSQAAIMALPAVRARKHGFGRVAVPMPGYREHGHAWRRAGFDVVAIPEQATMQAELAWLDSVDVVVWIQPNNPTGELIPVERLLVWWERLRARQGWLIVDEAFLPACDQQSLIAAGALKGLIVLKSMGKFFGLAGLRAGAVIAEAETGRALMSELGPWPVSGPARYIMAEMLQDRAWQLQAKDQLEHKSQRLGDLLSESGLGLSDGTILFRYLRHARANDLHHELAHKGILVRLFENPLAIRVGLPGTEQEWHRLEQALERLVGQWAGGHQSRPLSRSRIGDHRAEADRDG
ncbi:MULTISPECIES: threonine-phosphate decarboxylase CobD [unclassified Marinobacter]|uniref:threonine-phosphate decarboxylase CobD n=1 Tax=unclassified Marinobacter TaxID=83889 RepID=UPI002B1BD580|nr:MULTISPECIES: threonine-phosphate decarboxylase CobD [unclassified Marinobacter]